MTKPIYKGNIDGEFHGFDDEVLFKLSNGSYWIQTRYKYWYHYEYKPEVVITEGNEGTLLTVGGNSVSVRRVSDVIESRIEGAFEGWKGNSSYKLINGQVWQQIKYKYQYKYVYRPEVIIYPTNSGHNMLVAGTIANVRRVH